MKKVSQFFGHLFVRGGRRKSKKKSPGKDYENDAKHRPHPQSPAVSQGPVSPGSHRNGPAPQHSTSLEELVREHQEDLVSQKPETPLGKYPVGRGEKIEEKGKDGSILYFQPKNDKVNPARNLPDPIPLSRVPTRSSEDAKIKDPSSRQTTPNNLREAGGLRSGRATPNHAREGQGVSLRDSSSERWSNPPNEGPGYSPEPPLPLRKYLEDHDLSNSDDSRLIQRFPGGKALAEQPVTPQQASIERQAANRSPHNVTPPQLRLLGSDVWTSSPQRASANPAESSRRPGSGRHFQRSPESGNVFYGSENMAYVMDASPQRQLSREEGVNMVQHQDLQHYRQQQREDVQRRPPLPVGSNVDLRHQDQRRRHASGHVQGSAPLSNYDANRNQLMPGVYMRPKPYYARPGMQDPTKRYSDASDYSDLYDRRSYYDDRGGNQEYDPYFFRSRWSMAMDSLPSDSFQRQRSSDFHSDENFQQQRQQQFGRPRIDDEQYAPNDINDHPAKPRDGRYSPGYHSQNSLGDQPLSNLHHQRKPRILPVPPRSSITPLRRARSQRVHRSSPRRQQISLPEVPFNYSLPDHVPHSSPRRTIVNAPPNPPPLDVVHERYHEERYPQVQNERFYPQDIAREQYQNTRMEQKLQPQDGAVDHASISSHLATPNGHDTTSKRSSSDYGSLVDVMYRYRQNVRDSRQKEKPRESPASRLRYEREKLKAKLTQELEPRHQAAKNLDMVVETLLYLCETDNTLKKRSRQKERLETKSRPNSAILLAPADDRGGKLSFDDSDVTKDGDDYARIRSSSLESTKTVEAMNPRYSMIESSNIIQGVSVNDESTDTRSGDIPLYSKIIKPKPRLPSHFAPIETPNTALPDALRIPDSAPPDSGAKEFAFPSEEELSRILKQPQSKTPPPLPPRRNRDRKPSSREDTPPPVSSRGSNVTSSKSSPVVVGNNRRRTPNTSQSETPPPITPRKDILTPKVSPVLRREPHATPAPSFFSSPDSNRTNEAPNRRSSLPGNPLTESEMKWLQELGGAQNDVIKKKKLHKTRSEQVIPSTKAQRDDRRAFALPERTLVSATSEMPIHEEDDIDDAFLDELPTDEDTDAEAIISAIERHMSEKTKSPGGVRTPRQRSPAVQKPGGAPVSDTGARSSASSSELRPAAPRRARLQRSEGRYPSTENTPSGSPVFFKRYLNTPPLDGSRDKATASPPIPPRRESLSPVSKLPGFQTPPPNPLTRGSSPIAISIKASSSSNVSRQSPGSSPRIQPQPPAPQFTPRKQPGYSHKPISPRNVPAIISASAPVSPAGRPRHSFARRSSKHMAKIPFLGKRFVQSTSESESVVSLDTERRRVSRTGEIIILPADDDYADPFDCVNRDASPSLADRHRFLQFRPGFNVPGPQPAFNRTREGDFYPISEDNDFDDYAEPINSPPNLLLKQRILSHSQENLIQNLETAV